MTRKDTILIAVVINAGLLATLFITAVIYDTDSGSEQMEFASIADNKTPPEEPPETLIASASTGDEVDNVLKYYSPPKTQPIVVQTQSEIYISEPVQSHTPHDENIPGRESTSVAQDQSIEVKVKRGDMLEKIARANKTTVAAIKQANNLESERLSIGQVLKIPVKQDSSISTHAAKSVAAESKAEVKLEIKKESAANEPVYYVIKSGDNPWKIAKQFGVKYDEILRLNNLDEEKARNLKIGDRIRVK